MDKDPQSKPQSKFITALTRERNMKGLHGLHKTFESFSITSKVVFLVAALVLSTASLSLVYKISELFMVEVPSYGGTITEGIVGTARFVNPLLASSDADRDLTALVYSGLIKSTVDGDYVPDLAESFTLSDDGLTYSFKIRSDAVFHDGKPVTADDIEFTILKAQDSALKSPRRASWEGVLIKKISTHEIVFNLKQPYAPFISNLSIGILPKHIWQSYESDQFPFSKYNVNAIGSGPYKVSSINSSKDGVPVSYNLVANDSYALGKPYISKINLKFYTNDNALISALKNKEIESASNISPETASSIKDSEKFILAPFTRIFGIFFNQNQDEILAHKEVRKALNVSIDKQNIVDEVLKGFGTIANEPLPPVLSLQTISTSDIPKVSSIEEASSILIKAGWGKDSETGIFGYKASKTRATSTLSLSLSTANVPELIEAAHRIEENWKTLGAEVDVKVFDSNDLNQTVIRPRKYDALLFGIITGKNPDLYAFWHSSQRNDPGLNVALYTNKNADAFLEAMRKSIDAKDFNINYEKFAAEVSSDIPAIFLWSPDFIYVVPEKLQGISLGQITTPSDRFQSIEKWYISKEKVWKIFSGQDQI